MRILRNMRMMRIPPSYGWHIDEWNTTGASAVPVEKALEQRETYFKGIKFRDINELLEDAKHMEVV